MQYVSYYKSPLGNILLAADDIGLTGLWLNTQKPAEWAVSGERGERAGSGKSSEAEKRKTSVIAQEDECEEKEALVLVQTKRWLDIYFSGKEPDFEVPLHFIGTDFQKEVWEILCTIPYGKTITYGDIAKQIAAKRGIARMSAQAVGGAVGTNNISIIVPCHRVVGANGNLTGYGGGLAKKIALLEIEGVDMQSFYVPKKGNKL